MRFCETINKAKLGLRVTPGTLPDISNNVLPAIPDTHSILIEEFSKHRSFYRPGGIGYISLFSNAAVNEYHAIRTNFATSYCRIGYITLSTVGGGGTVESFLSSGTERWQYYAYLLDKTSFLKTVYYNGAKIISPAMAVNNRPTYNAANNRIWLFFVGTAVSWDCEVALFRLTTLNGVPADMDTAIARMYRRPCLLDASLQAAAVLASQWDFEDFNTIAPATNVPDHGIVGGYPLTSSVSLADKICIVEKP